jgi:hypothetical protein
MTFHNWSELRHRDPACTAGFTAVLDAPGVFSGGPTTEVQIRCWSCNTCWSLSALTPHTNDPLYDEHDRPVEIDPGHKPYLSTNFLTLNHLAASHPVEKAGAVFLHPTHTMGWSVGIYQYDVADKDGNVLGQVAQYLTLRNATRWAWGTPETNQTAGSGRDCTSARQAAKQLAAAVGVTK